MPETKLHLVLRTFLYQLLKFAFGHEACVGSEQFVYFNARDPRLCVAPDAFLKLGIPDVHFNSWKVWERGTPEVAVEILSGSDSEMTAWDEKVARYHELGVRELVCFDPQASEGHRLRVWDRIDEDLVERRVESDIAKSLVLQKFWVVRPIEEELVGLRLSEDSSGEHLLPSPREAEARAREVEARARDAAEARASLAEARVRELEAELRKR